MVLKVKTVITKKHARYRCICECCYHHDGKYRKNQQHSQVFILASFEYQVWNTPVQIEINLHDAVLPNESCDVALAYSCRCNLWAASNPWLDRWWRERCTLKALEHVLPLGGHNHLFLDCSQTSPGGGNPTFRTRKDWHFQVKTHHNNFFYLHYLYWLSSTNMTLVMQVTHFYGKYCTSVHVHV